MCSAKVLLQAELRSACRRPHSNERWDGQTDVASVLKGQIVSECTWPKLHELLSVDQGRGAGSKNDMPRFTENSIRQRDLAPVDKA